MLAKNFYIKLSEMIDDMSDEERIEILNQDCLIILKRIKESCDSGQHFAIVPNKVLNRNLKSFAKKFNLCVYYKRSNSIIFLRNFCGVSFSSFKDDRYRFLKCIFPKSLEYKNVELERKDFFEKALKGVKRVK